MEIDLDDAKKCLKDLVERVEAGDTITITRNGKAIARLIAAAMTQKKIDGAMLRALTASRPKDETHVVRTRRDEDRY